MLTQEILATVKSYMASMQKKVSFVLQSGAHEKRNELVDFLKSIASTSDYLAYEERETHGALRSPLSFFIEADGIDTGIRFSGIPSGHEFNSLILATLQSSGTAVKLDSSVADIISNLEGDLNFEVFVSLSCHNCPDVVQALNQFAILNPNISAEMIDGGLYQELINDRDIQGVPSVYLNGELFANGKVDTAQLIEKLLERNITKSQVKAKSQTKAALLPLQDVVVIGGGPAGVSAAIYSARKGLAVTLIADRIGGQVKDTIGIENFISVPNTTGSELSGALAHHIAEYNIVLKEHLKVVNVNNDRIKTVVLSSGETIHSKSLIIATGAQWRELGVPGEKDNIGNGVAYCPHCDGPFFKGKHVAVIGGGNSGIEAALDLAGIVKSVTVFEFMPELKADKILIDQAEQRDNIVIKKNAATKSIKSHNGKVNAIEYIERDSGAVHDLELEGVFVQIGLVPNSSFLGDLVAKTPSGEIAINEKCETSEAGIYACGDVTTVPFKQIIISMGEGSKASLSSFEYLVANTHELESEYEKNYLLNKQTA